MTYLDVEHADLLLLDILLLRNLGESVELYRRMPTISSVFFKKIAASRNRHGQKALGKELWTHVKLLLLGRLSGECADLGEGGLELFLGGRHGDVSVGSVKRCG